MPSFINPQIPLGSASVTAIPANAGLLKITFHSSAVKFALVAIVCSRFEIDARKDRRGR
jgi:hypothetical protein